MSVIAALCAMSPAIAQAVSSWNPTLLVNTESFEEIDDGDGTTDIELRFGASSQTIKFLTTSRFQFSHSISVLGTLSGRLLRVDGASDLQGPLAVSGAIRTDGNLTINDDQTASTDTILTFGSDGTNETLTFLNTADKFQFSDDLSILGTISGSLLRVDGRVDVHGPLSASGTIRTEGAFTGSSLTIDGNLTLHGITYSFPTSQSANTFLKTDGNGALTWATQSVANGSGGIQSLHPQYPNAVYFASGSAFIGQLTQSGGTSALENSYQWTSTKSTLQDYWISTRIRLPDNFSSWDATKPIELRYKTGVNGADNNHITLRMKDTAGAAVTLTDQGGTATGALFKTSFATINLKGPEASGTWTPKSYFTLYLKLAAKNTASAYAAASYINLNYETTTP